MQILPIVRMLTNLGERQGLTTLKAADLITSILRDANVSYTTEMIETFLPVATSHLTADDVVVDSAPTSYVGGEIAGVSSLVSSLIPTRYLIDVPNINVNPRSTALSRPNFYFAPSLAVRRGDVPKLLEAKEVRGEVEVTKTAFSLPQILVGNTTNPKAIVFAHYDSIGPGAIDNASGTAACLALVCEEPQLLETTLFVFDPNEELSYDKPTYWGHGYRVFEERYGSLLAEASRIIAVDCVGNGAPQVIDDPAILNLAFPIKSLPELLGKIVTIGGDIDMMMEVYQGDTDLPELLTEDSLRAAKDLTASLIR